MLQVLTYQREKKFVANREIQELQAELTHSKAMVAGRWCALELEIAEIAKSAKDDFSQSVQHVKEAISISHQVTKRPWTLLATSVLTGIVISRMRGLSTLAVTGLTSSLLKNTQEVVPATTSSNPDILRSNDLSESSSLLGNEQISFIGRLSIQAISSLSEIAKELVKKNI